MMINIGFIIKIFKLVVTIANITYFFGLFWYIFCDIVLAIQFSAAESDIFHQEHALSIDSFQENFGLDQITYN